MPNYTYSDDPDSAVKNKLGAKTHEELERAEAAYVAAREAAIQMGQGPSGGFDAKHLKEIHRYLFQDVYEWAGHTRDEKVRLFDGTIATEPLLRKAEGGLFMVGPLIPDALETIAEKLRNGNHLRGLPREEFATRAADIMAEINAAHPFREGNGRTQRAFISELAAQAGHELDFSVVSRERMIQASIAANERGDNTMMRRMFNEISDPVRVAALTTAIEYLQSRGFPWNDRYISTTEPGHSVDATFAGTSGKHFMARTSSGILIGQISDLPANRPARNETFVLKPTRWENTTANRRAVDSEHSSASRSTERATGLRVAQGPGRAAIGLVDFVTGLLAAGVPSPSTPAQQIAAERRALAVMEAIADDIAAGRDLKPEDLRHLTPTHLENIKARGDAYVMETIRGIEKDRERYLSGERGR